MPRRSGHDDIIVGTSAPPMHCPWPTGSAAASHRTPPRAGSTIVELLVALTVLGVGLLTLADATAAMQRRVLRDAWRLRATELVVSRAEWMRMHPCAEMTGGERSLGGARERWSITVDHPIAHLQHRLDVTAVTPPLEYASRVVLWCRP